MSRPDLLFFGFCFLFVTSSGSVKCMFGLFIRSFLYIHSFLCWCVGAVLRFPLRPSAKRWDTSPAGGGKCTGVNRGKVCGKAKSQKRLSYHKVSLYLRACTWLPLRGSWREAPERGEKQQKEKHPLSRALSAGLAAGFCPLYNFCEKECSLTPGLPARLGCGCGGPASQGRGRSRRRWGR